MVHGQYAICISITGQDIGSKVLIKLIGIGFNFKMLKLCQWPKGSSHLNGKMGKTPL